MIPSVSRTGCLLHYKGKTLSGISSVVCLPAVFCICGCVLPEHVCLFRLLWSPGVKRHSSSFICNTAAAVAAIVFAFSPQNVVNFVFWNLNLVLIQLQVLRLLVAPTGIWKYIFIFCRKTLGDRERVLIRNRYSKMRNFCTTIATSVSERISMVGRIGQCVLF